MSKLGRPFGSFSGKHPTRVGGVLNPLYQRWIGMRQRCMNPNSHIWKYYGGRGIKVCERWLGRSGFDNFCDDMGPIPEGGTLDRIDNNGNYTPENCKWSTMKEQATNRRPGCPSPNPESLRQRALAAGLTYHAVYFRIHRSGWSEERALSEPLNERGKWRRQSVFDSVS